MDQQANSELQQGSQNSVVADDEIDLLGLLGALLDKRWTIISVTAAAIIVSVAVVLVSTPIYQAGALLQIEEKTASLPGLEDLAEAFASESSTQAELEIIKSRSVIGAAVENLSLTTTVEPKLLPVIGGFLARRFAASDEAQFGGPWFGLDSYAWGGEEITVDRLEVDSGLLEEPLTLVVGRDNRFSVVTEAGLTLVSGTTGVTAVGELITVFVSKLSARPATEFLLSERPWLKAVQSVQESISVSEAGKQSGIIRISLQDDDADSAEAIVDEVAKVYVEQNISRLSAEAENSLNFMREQIPYIQRDVQEAEAAFNQFASENQSIDVTAENQAVLSQLVELDTRIQELELERVELNRRFTSNHPNVIAAEEQYRQLTSERARFNQRIEALPDTQQQLVSLRRDVEVASGIYELLLYKAQEMEVARASTVGNVRIIDTAIVDRSAPVAPKKSLIVVLGTLLGGLAGVAWVLLQRAIYRGVESADQIESIGLSVFSSIPFSAEQQRWDDPSLLLC